MNETPLNKSFYYCGRLFHILFDPLNRQARDEVVSRIPEGSNVLDVACGTGELALSLRSRRSCSVVGIDLSAKMIRFCNRRNEYSDVTFLHRDATNIIDVGDQRFDYGVTCMLLHEVSRDTQVMILREMDRLCKKMILVDYTVPLPKSIPGMIGRLIEATITRDHYQNFTAYLAAGGIEPILAESGLGGRVANSLRFNYGLDQMIEIS